jgi:hypothetical protein
MGPDIFISDSEEDRLEATTKAMQWLFDDERVRTDNWESVGTFGTEKEVRAAIIQARDDIVTACIEVVKSGRTPMVMTNIDGVRHQLISEVLKKTNNAAHAVVISCYSHWQVEAQLKDQNVTTDHVGYIHSPPPIAEPDRRPHWQKIFDYLRSLDKEHPFKVGDDPPPPRRKAA